MPDKALYGLAAKVGEALKAQGLMLATAESCTGGWVAQAVTAVPGSSKWFERGFVTYTYISKREMLGVSQDTLAAHGAVSEPIVREMVTGALANSHAQIAVAISGTAGPDGGTPDKPVGTVCLAWAVKNGEPKSTTLRLSGDREGIRRAAVRTALEGVLELLPTVPVKYGLIYLTNAERKSNMAASTKEKSHVRPEPAPLPRPRKGPRTP